VPLPAPLLAPHLLPVAPLPLHLARHLPLDLLLHPDLPPLPAVPLPLPPARPPLPVPHLPPHPDRLLLPELKHITLN
jgi:hypothetical protein